MSRAEENVALARKALAAFSSREFDVALATMHPDVEWHLFIRLPDLGGRTVYRGRDEVRLIWEHLVAAWERFSLSIAKVLGADDEHILFEGRFRGRGAESGIEVDRVVYYHLRIVDGRLAYIKGFEDEAEAWRDAGLDREADAWPGPQPRTSGT